MGIIIPILSFFVAINITFAYFTATTSSSASQSTAKLIIKVADDTVIYANSNVITNDSVLLPGDTLTAVGSVENNGNINAYVILKLTVSISKAGTTSKLVVCDKIYSFTNSTLQEVVKTGNTYSCNAFVLNGNATKSLTIPYTLDFNQIGNDYQNGSVSYSLEACAIQFASIENAQEATTLLIDYLTKMA